MRFVLSFVVLPFALALNLFAQPDAAETLLREATQFHQSGKYAEAIQRYEQYLKVRPDSVLALGNYGAALSHEGRFAEAIAEYTKVLKIEPANPQSLANLGIAYYKTGQIPEARDRFVAASKLLPGNRQLGFLLADCYVRLADYKKAIATLAPWENDADDPTLNYLLGTALIQDGQVERGSVAIDRILRKGDSAEAHLLLGTAKLAAHDPEAARQDLDRSVELNPRLPAVHAYLGLALSALGDYDAAALAFQEELKIDPYNFTAVFQSGLLANREQHFDAARTFFLKSLVLHPGDPLARFQIAMLNLRDGRVEEARTGLESLVKEAPEFLEAHVNLATAYYRLQRRADGDKERAIVRDLTAARDAKAAADAKAREDAARKQ